MNTETQSSRRCAPGFKKQSENWISVSAGEAISGGIYPILPCSVANFTEVDTLINIADKALYYAKTNGRDQFIMAECADDLPCTKVEPFQSTPRMEGDLKALLPDLQEVF